MTEQDNNVNPYFMQLVLSLQSAAMFQMGKTASPMTGKIERDMAQARVSIDLIIMMQEKTKGNLSEEEQRIIDSTVYNLQMNYMDEVEKEAQEEEKKEESSESDESKPGADTDKPENETGKDS